MLCWQCLLLVPIGTTTIGSVPGTCTHLKLTYFSKIIHMYMHVHVHVKMDLLTHEEGIGKEKLCGRGLSGIAGSSMGV